MYHGLRFDRTGQVVEIPGQRKIPSSLRVRRYPVVERHGWIWVWMGDAAAADQNLIPPVTGLDHTDYVCGQGQFECDAEARFVNDNLLDLSHLSYLHADSVPDGGEDWARERANFTEYERSVRIGRWLRNRRSGLPAVADLVDAYNCYDFFVPGVFVQTTVFYPLGTADALKGQPPADYNQVTKSFFMNQAITPLTEKTARSSYIVAAHRQYGGQAQCDLMMAAAPKVFAEDKAMVEAQQRMIDTTPNWRFIATSADRGVVLYNRLVEKLSGQEAAGSK
jgi:vanillate O-demethylase monooxygenase subunit